MLEPGAQLSQLGGGGRAVVVVEQGGDVAHLLSPAGGAGLPVGGLVVGAHGPGDVGQIAVAVRGDDGGAPVDVRPATGRRTPRSELELSRRNW